MNKRDELRHRLPIRDFEVEVCLPRDLTPDEAGRVGRWIASLAADWAAPTPGGKGGGHGDE